MQSEFDHAKQLIRDRKYNEARQLISKSTHPKRDEWLAQIGQLERKNGMADSSARQPAIKGKSNKALPLLPHEEREILPRGKPVDPQSILADRVDTGRRARAWIWIFGGKSGALINNYFRMNRTFLAIIFLLLYAALFIAWFPSFGIGFILAQRLFQTGTTHFPALIVCILVIVTMPFSPNIIAWVQQEHYQQWVENFNNMRRDYLSSKG